MSALEVPERFPSETPGAYRWFYFDAISRDGSQAMVAIFFIGSVFSPYYARRLNEGRRPLPREHLAVNLALYQKGARPIFVFSEYGAGAGSLNEDPDGVPQTMTVGRSMLRRQGDHITVDIDDRRVGLRTPIKGRATIELVEAPLSPVSLAPGHGWRGHAPRTLVTARFGDFVLDRALGYHDENWGREPPGRAFANWSWGRVHDGDRTRVVFDLERRGVGARMPREHLSFDSRDGASRALLPQRRLSSSFANYLLPLPETFDVGLGANGRRLAVRPSWLLERAPFYLRFLAPIPPRGALSMGEHIDFSRVDAGLVRRMVSLRVARPERGDYGIIP